MNVKQAYEKIGTFYESSIRDSVTAPTLTLSKVKSGNLFVFVGDNQRLTLREFVGKLHNLDSDLILVDDWGHEITDIGMENWRIYTESAKEPIDILNDD